MTQAVPDALLAALDAPFGAAIATEAEYAGGSLSAATRRVYTRDWWPFPEWCREQAINPVLLPVHALLVAAYLSNLAETLGRSALNGRLAAIAYEQCRRGHGPRDNPRCVRPCRGVGRRHDKPRRWGPRRR